MKHDWYDPRRGAELLMCQPRRTCRNCGRTQTRHKYGWSVLDQGTRRWEPLAGRCPGPSEPGTGRKPHA